MKQSIRQPAPNSEKTSLVPDAWSGEHKVEWTRSGAQYLVPAYLPPPVGKWFVSFVDLLWWTVNFATKILSECHLEFYLLKSFALLQFTLMAQISWREHWIFDPQIISHFRQLDTLVIYFNRWRAAIENVVNEARFTKCFFLNLGVRAAFKEVSWDHALLNE